jgi:hypothetical protein
MEQVWWSKTKNISIMLLGNLLQPPCSPDLTPCDLENNICPIYTAETVKQYEYVFKYCQNRLFYLN